MLFDFGGVVDGYCSDFGRTIYCGEPPAEVERAYEAMLAGQEAGRAAARPGVLAREVNAACRGPIEEAGLGEHFRHRMGHAIGLDVHERPFVSPEDETPLEAGMTFTDEPSIIVPARTACGSRTSSSARRAAAGISRSTRSTSSQTGEARGPKPPSPHRTFSAA